MDHRVSVSNTGLLLISSLFERHGLCLISNNISIQYVTQNSPLFVTYRALTGKYQIAKKDYHKTALVTSKGKYFKVFLFRIANAL